MAVVSIGEWRAARAAEQNATCVCGSQWFSLVRVDPSGAAVAGAVSIANDGTIFGYSGFPRCVECGNDFKP